MQNELKPCPFCGGEVRLVHTNHKTLYYRVFQFSCNQCGTTFFIPQKSNYKSKEDTEIKAIEAWNRRVEDV